MAATCLATGSVSAATITVTLDDVTVGNCETVWMESDLSLWFTQTAADDAVAGSARARLYRESSQVYYAPSFQEGAQNLVLDNVGQNADQLVVSAFHAYVWEIRLIGPNIVPDTDVSFGTIKAQYR